jgi:hypothetical protein
MAKTEPNPSTNKRDDTRIPKSASVEEEAEFWDTHSTTEFEDEFAPVEDLQFVVIRGEPKKALTVRLPQSTVDALSKQAREQGIGPSTLVRMWILKRLRNTRQ